MVMPIYDDNPFRLPHRPVVTWGLILFNLLVFLIEVSSVEGPNEMIYRYGLVPTIESCSEPTAYHCLCLFFFALTIVYCDGISILSLHNSKL